MMGKNIRVEKEESIHKKKMSRENQRRMEDWIS